MKTYSVAPAALGTTQATLAGFVRKNRANERVKYYYYWLFCCNYYNDFEKLGNRANERRTMGKCRAQNARLLRSC